MNSNNNEKLLVSSCLAGFSCRYNGKGKPNKEIIELVKSGRGIPICAEQLAGLSIPRAPAEIVGGDGADALNGEAKVLSKDGEDYTARMVTGAEKALAICKLYNIKKAYLKSKSPSCGVNHIYDGTFSDKIIKGDGVLSALLKKNGIDIIEVE